MNDERQTMNDTEQSPLLQFQHRPSLLVHCYSNISFYEKILQQTSVQVVAVLSSVQFQQMTFNWMKYIVSLTGKSAWEIHYIGIFRLYSKN